MMVGFDWVMSDESSYLEATERRREQRPRARAKPY